MQPAFTSLPAAETIDSLREAAYRTLTAESFYRLGLAQSSRGEIPDAIEHLGRAVRLEPGSAAYAVGLGEAWFRAAAFEEAAAAFARALDSDPGCWRAADWLACVYADVLQRPLDACASALQSIGANPHHTCPYVSLARARLECEPLAPAIALMDLQLPGHARQDRLRLGIGLALTQLGRYDEARDYLAAQLRKAPEAYALVALLGRVEHTLGNGAAAQARFQEVRGHLDDVTVCDEYTRYAWRTGDYAAARRSLLGALVEEDGRSRAPSVRARRVLLATGGNGFGDEIQWAGTAPLLQRWGASVALECRTPLRRLFETIRGIDEVVVVHDAAPSGYERRQFFRLLREIDWTWEELGGQVPYLRVPRDLEEDWRRRAASYGDGLHVGIEWLSSGSRYDRDPFTNRSVPIQALSALSAVPGVTLHALHFGATGLAQVASNAGTFRLSTLSSQIGDFMDTAAAVSALDAIVTADTAVAHIAGALGKPAFLMLPYYPEWRWGDERTPFHWYPSLTRFQQASPGDWTSVVERVADRLRATVRAAGGHAAPLVECCRHR